MNFTPLFLTARVVTAVYRTVSTTVLLYYLSKKIKNRQKISRVSRRVDLRKYTTGYRERPYPGDIDYDHSET